MNHGMKKKSEESLRENIYMHKHSQKNGLIVLSHFEELGKKPPKNAQISQKSSKSCNFSLINQPISGRKQPNYYQTKTC